MSTLPPAFSPANSVAAAPPPRSWFSRNWKWFVPLVVITPILLFTLFIGGIIALVFGIVKSSEPYKHGVQVVTHDPHALRALGSPVEIGSLVSGSTNETGASGEANLAIPVHGSAHAGQLYVIAEKSGPEGEYKKLQLWGDGDPNGIELLHHTIVVPEDK